MIRYKGPSKIYTPNQSKEFITHLFLMNTYLIFIPIPTIYASGTVIRLIEPITITSQRATGRNTNAKKTLSTILIFRNGPIKGTIPFRNKGVQTSEL